PVVGQAQSCTAQVSLDTVCLAAITGAPKIDEGVCPGQTWGIGAWLLCAKPDGYGIVSPFASDVVNTLLQGALENKASSDTGSKDDPEHHPVSCGCAIDRL